MRIFTILITFFFTGTIFSQVSYISYFTQSYPTIFTAEIQKVERRITFEPKTITIATEVDGGKEIEVLKIVGHDMESEAFTFFCESRNGKKITISIPRQEKVEIIDYYYRSPDTSDEIQLRFHVEKQ